MNYYEARQTKDKAGWHFTSMNDGQIWPVGYCADHEPHATPEEARECFRKYLLDGSRELTYADWTGCEVCDTPTKKALSTRPPLGNDHALCDEHRTLEQLEALTEAPERIMASY